jgi:hypothetical protein
MIGLLIVFCAGVFGGFVAGLSAGLWARGDNEQTG